MGCSTTCRSATNGCLILDADQAVPPALRAEIAALLARPPAEIREDGFYIRRRRSSAASRCASAANGGKYLLKSSARPRRALSVEQDTRVYVRGAVGRLRAPLEEHNRKKTAILFYLQKHLRMLTPSPGESWNAGAPPD